jgi:lactoylglutathione lyase
MRLDHVAIWTSDLERLRAFYEKYFGAQAGALYRSRTRAGFSSYFLTFPGAGGRLELMSMPGLAAARGELTAGYAHVALAVGSRTAVDALTQRLQADGVRVVGLPRQTGDGYYEAVIEDPDGNTVEITG